MLGSRPDPFPLEAVRDLLGVARAIYAATPAREKARRAALARVGEDLRVALELAAESSPGTVGERAAWARAERACEAIGRFVGVADAAEPIVRAAMRRVGGR